jgi:NADH dehydrogenase FAD-containing subunit
VSHRWKVVIVGAGATGVELAGAIGELARQTLMNDFRSIRPEEAKFMLIDGAPRVLMPFPEDLAQKAARALYWWSLATSQVRCVQHRMNEYSHAVPLS